MRWPAARSPSSAAVPMAASATLAIGASISGCRRVRTVDIATHGSPPGGSRAWFQRSRPCGHSKMGLQVPAALPCPQHLPQGPSEEVARSLTALHESAGVKQGISRYLSGA